MTAGSQFSDTFGCKNGNDAVDIFSKTVDIKCGTFVTIPHLVKGKSLIVFLNIIEDFTGCKAQETAILISQVCPD